VFGPASGWNRRPSTPSSPPASNGCGGPRETLLQVGLVLVVPPYRPAGGGTGLRSDRGGHQGGKNRDRRGLQEDQSEGVRAGAATRRWAGADGGRGDRPVPCRPQARIAARAQGGQQGGVQATRGAELHLD